MDVIAKLFKDFTFTGKKLSSLSAKYTAVDFNESSDKLLAMERNMEMGETNPYRIEANYFGDAWADVLPIELHIVKNPCEYNYNQKDMVISKSEIREITRWLTSPHFPEWIEFEYEEDDTNDVTHYCGWFNNIETWVVGGEVYGFTLTFTNDSPFAYSEPLTTNIELNGSLILV